MMVHMRHPDGRWRSLRKVGARIDVIASDDATGMDERLVSGEAALNRVVAIVQSWRDEGFGIDDRVPR